MRFPEFIKKIDTIRVFKHNKINKIIISALKCGNRFMEESNCFQLIPLKNLTINDFKDVDEIFWIIREPEGHFISALITELQVDYTQSENKNQNEETLIINLIDAKLSEIVKENGFIAISHYQPRYEYLHLLIQDEINYFYKSTFVELKDLSKLVETVFECNYTFIEQKYFLGFGKNYLIDKITLLNLLETKFNEKWNEIKKVIIKETTYYNELHNIDFLTNFINRIDVLNKNIEKLIKNNDALLAKTEKLEYNMIQLIDNYKKRIQTEFGKKSII